MQSGKVKSSCISMEAHVSLYWACQGLTWRIYAHDPPHGIGSGVNGNRIDGLKGIYLCSGTVNVKGQLHLVPNPQLNLSKGFDCYCWVEDGLAVLMSSTVFSIVRQHQDRMN